ncbi:MAG: carboxymuconolactone decarboxylase family protein [Acetobacteraceae bacterium]
MARVPLIRSKDQVAPEHHAVVDAITASRGSLEGPFVAFLHSPEVAGRVAHLGTYVRFEGTLDFRVRVLAAMTVARHFEALYVWGAQTGSARRQNVPETTISAIRDNRSDGVPPEDMMIIGFTRALLNRHRVDDAMFKAMQDRFGNDQLIQLTTAIGYYSLLSMTVNACELDPAPGAERLETR